MPVIFFSCLLVAIGLLSRDIYLPALPAISHALAASPGMIANSITACLLGDGISEMIYGPVSDVIGRKKIILIGIIFCLIGNICAYFSTTGIAFWLSRFMVGVGVGAFPVATRAMARDCFEGIKLTKAIAYLSMAATLSPVIAPMIGGQLQYYFSWKADFIFLIGVLGVFYILVKAKFVETHSNRATRLIFSSVIKNYIQLLFHRQLMVNALLSAITFSFSISFFMISPFIFQNVLGLTSAENGLLYGFLAVGFFIGASMAAKFTRETNDTVLIFFGVLCCFFSAILYEVFQVIHFFTVASVVIPIVICMIGAGVITPIANKKSLQPFAKQVGYAAAMLGVIRMLCAFVMSYPISLLIIKNQHDLAMMVGTLSLIALFVTFVSI